jgi:hypothetical protein
MALRLKARLYFTKNLKGRDHWHITQKTEITITTIHSNSLAPPARRRSVASGFPGRVHLPGSSRGPRPYRFGSDSDNRVAPRQIPGNFLPSKFPRPLRPSRCQCGAALRQIACRAVCEPSRNTADISRGRSPGPWPDRLASSLS